jgi:SAM-dependent methyltransferase
MADIGRTTCDIASMSRGGPDASWLDRRLQTNRLEFLDRDDVDDRKRRVVRFLDRGGRLLGQHKKFARMALGEVADIPSPRILELGSGHGGIPRELLENHPSAAVTVTDIEPISVAAIAAGDLGSHPRATVRGMDATAIDAPDGYYDLVIFVMSLHHLPPEKAAQVLAEGTRVASKLLIIDMRRLQAPLHLVWLAVTLPFALVFPSAHDGFISSLRAYSPSALRALANYADPAITVELRRGGWGPMVAVASRARQTDGKPS